jgi:hypothetical protein
MQWRISALISIGMSIWASAQGDMDRAGTLLVIAVICAATTDILQAIKKGSPDAV